MEEAMRKFERLLNIKPEEPWVLSPSYGCFEFFYIISKNKQMVLSSSNFDNIIQKILKVSFLRRKVYYSLARVLLDKIEIIAGEADNSDIKEYNDSKFVIGLILQLLKEKNMIKKSKSFISSLLDEVNRRASRYRDKIEWSRACNDNKGMKDYQIYYEGIQAAIMAILEILRDIGMMECEEVFINGLDSTVKAEMGDILPKIKVVAKNASKLEIQTVESNFEIQTTKKPENKVELESKVESSAKNAPELKIQKIESNFRIQSTKKAEDEVELEKLKKDAPKLEIQKIKSNFEIKAKDTLLERLKVLLYSIFVRPFVKLYFCLSKFLRKTDVKITEPIVVNRNQNISDNIKKISELNHFGSTGSTPKIEDKNKITQNK